MLDSSVLYRKTETKDAFRAALEKERTDVFFFLRGLSRPALASRGTRTHSRGLLEQSPGEPSKERRARCGRLRRTAKDTLNRARGRRKARLSARLSDQSSIAVYLRRAGGAAAARHCAQTRRRRREPDLSRRVSPARQSGKDRWRLAIGACCTRLTAVARQKVVHLCLTLRVWLARGSH